MKRLVVFTDHAEVRGDSWSLSTKAKKKACENVSVVVNELNRLGINKVSKQENTIRTQK